MFAYAANNPVKYTDPDGKSEKEMLDEESKIPNFLQKIINNPENYEISVYQRAAIVRGNRGPIKVHSLYIIKDKENDTDYTLSFNGTVDFLPLSKGAWAINTPTDRAGYEEMLSGKNGYDMKLIVPNEVIDIKTTLNNIINSINSETKYYFMDHRSNMKNRENCNTALFNTLAISLPDYKLPRNVPQKPYFSFLLNTAPAFYQGR